MTAWERRTRLFPCRDGEAFPACPVGDSVCLHPCGSSHKAHSGCQIALIKRTKNHINVKNCKLHDAVNDIFYKTKNDEKGECFLFFPFLFLDVGVHEESFWLETST